LPNAQRGGICCQAFSRWDVLPTFLHSMWCAQTRFSVSRVQCALYTPAGGWRKPFGDSLNVLGLCSRGRQALSLPACMTVQSVHLMSLVLPCTGLQRCTRPLQAADNTSSPCTMLAWSLKSQGTVPARHQMCTQHGLPPPLTVEDVLDPPWFRCRKL
jgi:hypothetical protein